MNSLLVLTLAVVVAAVGSHAQQCDCGVGTCHTGEDPNGWGARWYCDCPYPVAGQKCQFPDPCGVRSGNNPCANNGNTDHCFPMTFGPGAVNGYECVTKEVYEMNAWRFGSF